MLVLTRRSQEWIDIPEAGVSILVCGIDHLDGRAPRVRIGVISRPEHRIFRREILTRERASVPLHQESEGRSGEAPGLEHKEEARGVGDGCGNCARRGGAPRAGGGGGNRDDERRDGDSVAAGSPAPASCGRPRVGKPGSDGSCGETVVE